MAFKINSSSIIQYPAKYTLSLILFVVLSGLLISSCNKGKYIKAGDSLDEAYKKAMSFYSQEKYSDAADAFETVVNMGRGTEYSRDAQYRLAESYFNNEQFLLAASEYERYNSLFPQSERRQQVDFKRALSFYNLSPRYKLDQKHTRKAIELFQLYLSRYPNSDRASEAATYIDEMREKLAHKIFAAAELYKRIDQYNAAALYYGLVIDKYPETSWAEKALVEQMDAYIQYADKSVVGKMKKRYNEAISTYETYVQLFPNGDNRSKAENYRDEAKSGIRRAEKLIKQGGRNQDKITFLGMTINLGFLSSDRDTLRPAADTTMPSNLPDSPMGSPQSGSQGQGGMSQGQGGMGQ